MTSAITWSIYVFLLLKWNIANPLLYSALGLLVWRGSSPTKPSKPASSILVALDSALNMFYNLLFAFHRTNFFETLKIEIGTLVLYNVENNGFALVTIVTFVFDLCTKFCTSGTKFPFYSQLHNIVFLS